MKRSDDISRLMERISCNQSVVESNRQIGVVEFYPHTVAEIQAILEFANTRKIAVTESLDGRFRDLSAEDAVPGSAECLVINTGEMNKIIQVNETSRYALFEPGVTHYQLSDYLQTHHPGLHHCFFPAHEKERIMTNGCESALNAFSARYGYAGNMVQGVEVVLPSGHVAKTGSCSVSPLWFSNGPIPDLRDFIFQMRGKAGVITKISLKLYPAPLERDFVMYILKDVGMIPDVIREITHCELADQITIIGRECPSYLRGIVPVTLSLTAASSGELKLKKNVLRGLFAKSRTIMFKENLSKEMRNVIQWSRFSGGTCELKNGREFRFIIPLPMIPRLWQEAMQIIQQNRLIYEFAYLVLDHSHEIMGSIACFDPVETGNHASLHAASDALQPLVIDLDGIFYPVAANSHSSSKIFDDLLEFADPNKIMRTGLH